MKTNKLKKAFLAVSLSTAMTIPTVTSLGSAMTSYAASNVPFCADTDNNGAVNIQENQIYVSRSYYEARMNPVSLKVTHEIPGRNRKEGYYIVSDGDITDLQPLAKYVLILDVSGDNISMSDMEGLQLTVDSKMKDGVSLQRIHPFHVEQSDKTLIVCHSNLLHWENQYLSTQIYQRSYP